MLGNITKNLNVIRDRIFISNKIREKTSFIIWEKTRFMVTNEVIVDKICDDLLNNLLNSDTFG